MKEKIRKKTKRPQTEDMIFTEEDFEDVSEETKGNSPKHRKRSRRTSGGFPARKAGIIAGGVIGVLVLLYLGISVFFMSHFYINTEINGHNAFLCEYANQRKRFFGKIGIICGGIYQRAGKRLQTDH